MDIDNNQDVISNSTNAELNQRFIIKHEDDGAGSNVARENNICDNMQIFVVKINKVTSIISPSLKITNFTL